ncbi:MAG: hypothetical protein QM680_01355 [Luteolibacter sp.]
MSFIFPIDEPVFTSSPELDLIEQAWEHIGDRYLARLKYNRVFEGRIRSILSLAAYDAQTSVTNPGNGHIYKETSLGSTFQAAAAASIQASHDILATVFRSKEDRQNLADHLEESLGLLGNEVEKEIGIENGRRSASTYIQTFSTLLLHRSTEKPLTRQRAGELVAA